MKRIYLDYAASTPVDPRVARAMRPYFLEKYGNPGSLHSFGQEAIRAVDLAREQIAKAISADFREVIFTGSATEANNLALRGVVRAFLSARATVLQNRSSARSSGERRSALSAKNSDEVRNQSFSPPRASSEQYPPQIIVSTIEHESVLTTARELEKEGIEVVEISVNRGGFVNLKKLKDALNERTILVSVMYANNEIGTIQPISEISRIMRDFRKQIANSKSQIDSRFAPDSLPLFHTDAVQAFQFLDCNVDTLGVDFLTVSGHKVYGPKGIGALFVRQLATGNWQLAKLGKKPEARSQMLDAMITGGGQEFGLRSGTENVPLIAGFAKAVELATEYKRKEASRIGKLRDYFWNRLKKIVPNIERNGGEPALPNMLNVYFPRHRAEETLTKLDLAGIAASSGSACRARSIEPSRVVQALGYSEERAKRSIRFSFGRPTTKGDIDRALAVIKKLVRSQ